mmetsp:Transcript_78700/g.190634  ORF Transcript_78700/g.190634 Transcript_78700/m.190634 type:complete len:95 (-) Transcript_78700:22-306(-)
MTTILVPLNLVVVDMVDANVLITTLVVEAKHTSSKARLPSMSPHLLQASSLIFLPKPLRQAPQKGPTMAGSPVSGSTMHWSLAKHTLPPSCTHS